MKTDKSVLLLRKQYTKQFFAHNKLMFVLACFSMLIVTVINLLLSWVLQQIIDLVSGVPTHFSLGGISIVCLACVLLITLSEIMDSQTRPRFIKKAMKQYKDYVFKEITKKSISSFSCENTSTYISALSNDIASIETNYISKIFSLVTELSSFVGAFAMMLYYSPLLTLVAFLISLFPVIGSLLTGNRLGKAEKIVSDKNEYFLGTVKDLLNGFSVIKSFKAELEVIELFKKSNEDAEESKLKRRKLEIIIQIIGIVTGLLAQFGVFIVGALLAQRDLGITAGVLIIFVNLMNLVISPIGTVPQILANKKSADSLIDKIALALNSNVRREGKDVDNVLDKSIEIKNVNFSYEKDKPVLKNLNMNFETGKSYAIVGGSGSGKSTLLNLIMGSSESYSGSIFFDDDELKTISSDSLYELVSIVQQNVFMFNSTIKDNITMFHNFDEQKIENAIKMSGLDKLITERGSSYMCGENGNALSGGERQRISIARCLLRETAVMLVDEATSALDSETAFAVTNSILDIDGLTRIIVTHRLEEALLKKYDQIVVMKNGSIAELGTFDELMEKKNLFYSLYNVAQD